MIRTKWGSTAVTKWDLISDKDKAYLEKTPFNHPCPGCMEMLETEADFARHFFLPNPAYRNIGYCPAKEGII